MISFFLHFVFGGYVPKQTKLSYNKLSFRWFGHCFALFHSVSKSSTLLLFPEQKLLSNFFLWHSATRNSFYYFAPPIHCSLSNKLSIFHFFVFYLQKQAQRINCSHSIRTSTDLSSYPIILSWIFLKASFFQLYVKNYFLRNFGSIFSTLSQCMECNSLNLSR